MTFPIAPTRFAENPYQPEWFGRDFMHTQDGVGEFPDHHCKGTFYKALPFVKRFGTAIDVGCRDGEYARYLQRYFPHTYCFDARLRKLFPYNVDLKKITHFTCALGDEPGKIEMYGGTHNPQQGKHHTVACFRLDDFAIDNVSYIKIDVEGFEKKVLMGGVETIQRDRPLIVIEQNSVTLAGEDPHAAKNWLETLGYRHVATCDRGWDYVMAGD